MSGTIGLTPAGQYIDAILFKEKPVYAKRLIRFINRFTKRCKSLRNQISEYSDRQFTLGLMRTHYLKRLEKEFKEVLTPTLYTCTETYITSLTRINFVPSTKTQRSLMRKKAGQGVSL